MALNITFEGGKSEEFKYKENKTTFYNNSNLKKIANDLISLPIKKISVKPGYIAVLGEDIYNFGLYKIIKPVIVLIGTDEYMAKNKDTGYYIYYTVDNFAMTLKEVDPISNYPINILNTNMVGQVYVMDEKHIGNNSFEELNKIKYVQLFQLREGFMKQKNSLLFLCALVLLLGVTFVAYDLAVNTHDKLNIDLESLKIDLD